jgi:hypothetical protein
MFRTQNRVKAAKQAAKTAKKGATNASAQKVAA